jgi:hypothetical protein
VAADPCRRQRQPQRIEHREIDLQLQQVRVMILAVAELKQPLFGHPPIVFGRRCINPHPLRAQVIDAQRMLTESPSALLCPGRRPARASVASAHGSTWLIRWLASESMHPVELDQQQRNIIDSFVIDGKWLGHTESLPQFLNIHSKNERTMSY